MHRDRIIELCMPYGTLLPHAHVSGHKELCPTCWGGVAWAVAPPVGVVRPGLWLHVLGWCGLGCGSTCWGGVAWAVAPPVGVLWPGLWPHLLPGESGLVSRGSQGLCSPFRS